MGKRYKVIPRLVADTGVSERTVKRRISELGYTAEQVGESIFRYAVVNVLLDNKKAETLVRAMQRQADKIKVLEERPDPTQSEPEVDYKVLYESSETKADKFYGMLEEARQFLDSQGLLDEYERHLEKQ